MRRGFTLLELVVSMAIIGLAFTVSVPAFRDFSEAGADGAVTEVRALLQTARRQAVESGRRIELTIDPVAGDYWVVAGGDEHRGRLSLEEGSRLSAPEPRLTFVFQPDGSASAVPFALSTPAGSVEFTVVPWSGEVRVTR